jgi:ribosomal peptide maturation radical SAM protein 1
VNKTENLDVLLINMPFGISTTPSLALSLLKEAVKKKGYSVLIKYYTLKFAKLIDVRKYNSVLYGKITDLLGDWLFSGTLFPGKLNENDYVKNILNGTGKNHFKKRFWNNISDEDSLRLIMAVKSQAEPFINSCLQEIIAFRPKIVGFSTSFQQNIASLSLAKRIKEHCPETIIVFGGANCEGEMGREIARKFPFVDIVVSGEADNLFPELVAKIIKNERYSHLKGVICQDNLNLQISPENTSEMIVDMDSLPVPDYDDYFEQVRTFGLKEQFPNPSLLFESSRGCWWGEKSHCTFCGLNGNNMVHRSKSAARVIDEIRYLKDKYRVTNFSATDNILDISYFKDFVPALAREQLNVNIFYEVKANLTKEQLLLLKAANIVIIQPGIESLNTHVLDLMKKGVKSIQNIQLLKWCKEIGILVFWNIIWGFPGETKADYDEMLALIPKLNFLPPPDGISKIGIHRFSPNFNYPEKFGIKNITHVPSYNYIYPFEKASLRNLAYQFNYEYVSDPGFDLTISAINREVYKWQVNASTSDLFFIDQEDALVLFDLRPDSVKPYYILNKKERFVYLLCDKIMTITKINVEFTKYFNNEEIEMEIINLLNSLVDRNLLIRENNSYLSLAIPLGNYSPKKEVMQKLITVLKNKTDGDNQVRITANNELLIELNC